LDNTDRWQWMCAIFLSFFAARQTPETGLNRPVTALFMVGRASVDRSIRALERVLAD